MYTICAGAQCATISSVTCEPIDTFGSQTGEPPLSIVTFWLLPLPLVVHQPEVTPVKPRAAHAPVLLVIFTLLVPGKGLGSGGVGYSTLPGSAIWSPRMLSRPSPARSWTAAWRQRPTPNRGV